MKMIPNPTKKFTLNSPIETVTKIMTRIPEFSRCKIASSDAILNEYEFDFSIGMVGNIITLALSDAGEGKTEVNLEVRRYFGAFDSELEVTSATLDIKDISKALSTLIENPDAEVVFPTVVEANTSTNLAILMALAVAGIIGYLIVA